MSELEHTNTEPELVTVIDGVAATTTLRVAHGTGTEHRAVLQLVRTYLDDFEEFGMVAFEMRPKPAGQIGGGSVTHAILNENQAALLLTYMKNTAIVRAFKKELIHAFSRLRDRLAMPEISNREFAMRILAAEDALDAEREARKEVEQYARELEPVAESWLNLADAQGTLAVADVSAILNNDHGIAIGAIRLFRFMEEQGWIYRTNGPKSPWRPYQTQITAGRLTEKVGERYYHKPDGTYRLGTPSVRVTVKGLHRLRVLLSGWSADLVESSPVVSATPVNAIPG